MTRLSPRAGRLSRLSGLVAVTVAAPILLAACSQGLATDTGPAETATSAAAPGQAPPESPPSQTPVPSQTPETPPPPTVGDYPWNRRARTAERYARTRPGLVGFAVVGEGGKIVAASNEWNQVSSASVIKSMLLASYLRRPDVRDRPLSEYETSVLTPMIQRSDDAAGSTMFAMVGESGLSQFAADAGMSGFATSPHWGLSQLTPRDMARLFWKIDTLIPKRHRGFAMDLLGGVIRQQRWGIPPAVPQGWTWHIKGGWINGVVNQIALLTKGDRRIALAVLIEGTPDTEEGVQNRPHEAFGPATITGVVKRLLRGYESYGPER